MEYTIKFLNKAPETIHADNLNDAEIYALAVYGGDAIGSTIQSKDKNSFVCLPIMEYYVRDSKEFSKNYVARMELEIMLMAKENRLATGNPNIGISEEQQKILYKKYKLFRIWEDENWLD